MVLRPLRPESELLTFIVSLPSLLVVFGVLVHRRLLRLEVGALAATLVIRVALVVGAGHAIVILVLRAHPLNVAHLRLISLGFKL